MLVALAMATAFLLFGNRDPSKFFWAMKVVCPCLLVLLVFRWLRFTYIWIVGEDTPAPQISPFLDRILPYFVYLIHQNTQYYCHLLMRQGIIDIRISNAI
jgi:hypothetical protein